MLFFGRWALPSLFGVPHLEALHQRRKGSPAQQGRSSSACQLARPMALNPLACAALKIGRSQERAGLAGANNHRAPSASLITHSCCALCYFFSRTRPFAFAPISCPSFTPLAALSPRVEPAQFLPRIPLARTRRRSLSEPTFVSIRCCKVGARSASPHLNANNPGDPDSVNTHARRHSPYPQFFRGPEKHA